MTEENVINKRSAERARRMGRTFSGVRFMHETPGSFCKLEES